MFFIQYLGEEIFESLVTDTLPELVVLRVRVGHLVTQGAQGHVGSLRDIEQLALVRLHQFPTKQRPQLRESNIEIEGELL